MGAAEGCGAMFGTVTWIHDEGTIIGMAVNLELGYPECGMTTEHRVAD